VVFGQFAERGAGAVEQGVPTHLADPGFEHAALDTRRLVVVESLHDAARVEPRTRLLHRVAILDAVDRDSLGLRHITPTPIRTAFVLDPNMHVSHVTASAHNGHVCSAHKRLRTRTNSRTIHVVGSSMPASGTDCRSYSRVTCGVQPERSPGPSPMLRMATPRFFCRVTSSA